jgi:hypothetical protein
VSGELSWLTLRVRGRGMKWTNPHVSRWSATNARSCRIWTYDESVEAPVQVNSIPYVHPGIGIGIGNPAMPPCACHDTAHCDTCNLVQGKGDLRCACQPIKTDGDPVADARCGIRGAKTTEMLICMKI